MHYNDSCTVNYIIIFILLYACVNVGKAHCCKISTEKTVLGIFRERRRPITFNGGSTPKEEYGNLLEAVKSSFDNIMIANEGPSSSSRGIEVNTTFKEKARIGVALLMSLD